MMVSGRSNATDQIGGLSFKSSAVGVTTATMNALVDGTMVFKTAGEESVRITGIGGSVGIGVADPLADLHIETSTGGVIYLTDSDAVRKNGIRCASSDNLSIFADDDNEGGSSFIKFEIDGAERGRFDSTGDLVIEDGDLKLGTAGHGIDFANAGGSNAGSNSAILDDYEEGTWTIVYASGTLETAYSVGRYTKIGNMCTAWLAFEIDTVSTATHPSFSLPFAQSPTPTNSAARATGSIMTSKVNYQADQIQSTAYIGEGGSSVQIYMSRDNLTWEQLQNGSLASGDWMYITITYRTS